MEPEREENPFENPLLLSLIFKGAGASFNQLKEWRGVNRIWREECSKEMRKCSKVYTGVEVEGWRGLDDFVELLKMEESTWSETPFASAFCLSDEPADNPEFWRLCGAHITRLSLIRVSFETSDAFLRAICVSCPNLKDLRLDNVDFLEGDPADESLEARASLRSNSLEVLSCDGLTALEFGRLPVKIFDHLPALKVLNVVSEEEEESNGGDHLIHSLARAREQNPDVLDIKHILVDFSQIKDVDPTLEELLECDLKLEEFGIRKFSRHVPGLPILQQKSIRERNFTTTVIAENEEFLRQISIDDDTFGVAGVILTSRENDYYKKVEEVYFRELGWSVAPLRLFPNLTRLHLGEAGLYEEEEEEQEGDHQEGIVEEEPVNNVGIYPKITHLSVTRTILPELPMLGRVFPNVEHLMLGYPDRTTGYRPLFEALYQIWPNLKSLALEDYPLDATEITGYDEEDVKEINRIGGDFRPCTVRKPNISSMTKLESFVWTKCEWRPSYCSAVAGVLEVASLKNLVVDLEGGEPGEMVHVDKWKEALNGFSNVKPPPSLGNFQLYLF